MGGRHTKLRSSSPRHVNKPENDDPSLLDLVGDAFNVTRLGNRGTRQEFRYSIMDESAISILRSVFASRSRTFLHSQHVATLVVTT